MLGRIVRAQLLRFPSEIRMLGISLRTDRHILAGGHRHRAGDESATPAIRTSLGFAAAAATPTIRLAVETMPSLAPSTAALSQPIRATRWFSGWTRSRVIDAFDLGLARADDCRAVLFGDSTVTDYVGGVRLRLQNDNSTGKFASPAASKEGRDPAG